MGHFILHINLLDLGYYDFDIAIMLLTNFIRSINVNKIFEKNSNSIYDDAKSTKCPFIEYFSFFYWQPLYWCSNV